MCPSDRSLPALSIDSRKSVSLFHSFLLSPSSFAFSPFFSLSTLSLWTFGFLLRCLLERFTPLKSNKFYAFFSFFPPLLFYFSSFPDWKTIEIRYLNFETKRVINYEYKTRTSGKARFAAKHAYLHAQFWNLVFHSSLEYGTRKRISLRGNKTKTFVLINCFTSNNEKYPKFCPFSRISSNVAIRFDQDRL